MPKYTLPAGDGFAARLTLCRKGAGFTQEQLAAEIGSPAPLAYYERESDHPPASLLSDCCARVLQH